MVEPSVGLDPVEDESLELEPVEAPMRRPLGVRTTFETSFPVLVRGDPGLQRGFARNISEGGMLVQLSELPPIGSPVEITFAGIDGSADAPEPFTLHGEVRHHHVYQYAQEGFPSQLRAAGIRFAPAEPVETH